MKSMLIIDRSKSSTILFANLFERHGWNVAICGDRQGAIQRLTGDWPYDSILVGRVGGTDEVQLVGLIRGVEHRKTAAVVVITERAEVREETLAAGADEALLKPVNPNALLWAVDKHVSR
jgi:DNA-binding response OmpR family regulator